MRKWGVYHSLEETLHVLKADEYSSVPEIQELLQLFSKLSCQGRVKPETDVKNSHPFVVLEGLDACGKTTVSRHLARQCKGVVMSTPGPQFLYLRPFFDKQPQFLRRAYYSLSNYAAAFEISEALKKHTVILDRFWHSTAAYALAGQVDDIDELPKSGDPEYKWPKDLYPYPDAVFFLNVSEAERLKRHSARNTTNTAEEIRLAKEVKFRALLLEVYKRMYSPQVIEVNADQPIKEEVQHIYQSINLIRGSS